MLEKLVELDFFKNGDLEFLVNFIKGIGLDKFTSICVEFNKNLIIQVKNGTYKTNRELDLAIDGMGFVPVTTKEGKVAYTRSLSMTTTNEGLLVTPDGSVVAGGIKIPNDSNRVVITPQGIVMSYDSKHKEGYEIGRIPLVKFNNYEGLELGDFGKVYETEESGKPILVPNHTRFTQYSLERSNINIYDTVNDTLRMNASFNISKAIIKLTNEIYQQAVSLDQ